MIEDEIRPLKRNIRRIKRLIREWNEIPRAALLLRGKFIMMDLGKVKDLKADLSDHKDHLVDAMQVINFSHNASQSAQAKEQAIQRRREREIEENARKLRDAKEELHRLQTQASQNRIYDLLKRQDEKAPNSVSMIAKSGNTVLLGALERNLVESGLPAQDVKTHLGNFLAGLRQDLAAQPTQIRPANNIGGLLNNQTGVAIPRPTGPLMVPQPITRPLSAPNLPGNVIPPRGGFKPTPIENNNINKLSQSQFSVRPKPTTNSEGKRILCVDFSNGT